MNVNSVCRIPIPAECPQATLDTPASLTQLVLEPLQGLIPGADQLELRIDVFERLLEDRAPLLRLAGTLPARLEGLVDLLGRKQASELVEGDAEQVPEADQLLEAGDVRVAIEPVLTFLVLRLRAEQS